MVSGTEKVIRKFAKGYERRCGTGANYIAGEDMERFLTDLVSTFSGIIVGIRKDRGQGLFLSVLSSGKQATLYYVRVRNTNARGLVRTRVKYSFTVDDRDINLEFV